VTTTLIVGHPDLSTSRVNAALAAAALETPSVEVRILADLYPSGRLDVLAEQATLSAADEIVLLYPTYWYSTPAPLKRWLDEVLLRGWAYGTGSPGALAGKFLRVVTTTGGAALGYREGELHSYEYEAILAPLKATAHRLGMLWRAPLVIHGVRELDESALDEVGRHLRAVLTGTQEPDIRWALPNGGSEAAVLR
jgi:putative NADPH-quinone reductase